MQFVARWIASVGACFFLFPVAFVLWRGPDEWLGYLGAMALMFFLQFGGLPGYWLIPAIAGTLIGLAWHVWAERPVEAEAP
jgi:hypothetical protein